MHDNFLHKCDYIYIYIYLKLNLYNTRKSPHKNIKNSKKSMRIDTVQSTKKQINCHRMRKKRSTFRVSLNIIYPLG